MLDLITKAFTWYHLKRLKSKGERKTTITMEPIEQAMSVVVTSIRGYKLTFTCRKIQYTFSYQHSKKTDKHFVYKLYARSVDDLPDNLREVIKNEIYLPKLFPFFLDEDTNRKIMMNIYIAMLKEKINHAFE